MTTSPPPSPLPTTPADGEAVTLAPRPWVPLGVVAIAAALAASRPFGAAAGWLALATALFGAFLLLQMALLRLRFEADALQVLRLGQEIRRFPYAEWLGWKLLVPAVPVLFYFRERHSIHLLPVLFDATSLREQLTRRLDGRRHPAP